MVIEVAINASAELNPCSIFIRISFGHSPASINQRGIPPINGKRLA
jgi:hypothetical protein